MASRQPTREDLRLEIASILQERKETRRPTAGQKWDSLIKQVVDLLEVRLKAKLRARRKSIDTLVDLYYTSESKAPAAIVSSPKKPFQSSLQKSLAKAKPTSPPPAVITSPKFKSSLQASLRTPTKKSPSSLSASARSFTPGKKSMKPPPPPARIVQEVADENVVAEEPTAAAAPPMLLKDRIRMNKEAEEAGSGGRGHRSTISDRFNAIASKRDNVRGRTSSSDYKTTQKHPSPKGGFSSPRAKRTTCRKTEYYSKLQASEKQAVEKKPFKSSLAASISTSNASTEESRKLASDQLKLKFEARKKERESTAVATKSSSVKEKRVDSYYKSLAAGSEKKVEQKPFKSSLLSSIPSKTASAIVPKSRVTSGSKIIYSVSQLLALDHGKALYTDKLPDMTVVEVPGSRSSSRRGSGGRTQRKQQPERRGKGARGGSGGRYGGGNDRYGGDRGKGGGRYNDRRGNGRSRHHRPSPEPLFDGPVKPLEKSKNRWVPTGKTGDTVADVSKTLKSILNKMTRERFEKLSTQIANLEMSSLSVVTAVLTGILTKALEEPSFADVYADLCKILHVKKSCVWPFIKTAESLEDKKFYSVALEFNSDSIKGPFKTVEEILTKCTKDDESCLGTTVTLNGSESRTSETLYLKNGMLVHTFQLSKDSKNYYCTLTKQENVSAILGPFDSKENAIAKMAHETSIKKLLLNSVQNEFNRENRHYDLIAADATFKNLDEDEKKRKTEIHMRRAKLLSLGNIRFIGELFKVQMLKESAVLNCVKKLTGLRMVRVDGKIAAQAIALPDEDDIEALCKLLATVGKQIDHEKNRDMMDAVVLRLVELSELKAEFSSRIRFKLKDILEMRDYQWQPRRQELQQKTLEEVRREAEKLQRQGKNAQHDNVQGIRRKAAKSSKQLVRERGDILLHAEEVEEEKPASSSSTTEAESSSTNATETPVVIDREKLGIKVKGIIKEFLSIRDMTEAVQCVKELVPASVCASILAEEGFNMALESKAEDRVLIADLLAGLYEQSAVAASDVETGIAATLEFFEDMKIDIPKVHEYGGLVLGRLVAVGCFGLSWLQRSTSHLKQSGIAEQLLEEVLHVVRDESDVDTVSNLLSDIKLSEFLPSERTKEDFMQQNNDLFPSEDVLDDRAKNRVSGIMKEFISIQDVGELRACVEELSDAEVMFLLEEGFAKSLDCKDSERGKLAAMFQSLVEGDMLDSEDLFDAFSETFTMLEDIRVDVPKVEENVAQVLSPLLVLKAMDFSQILSLCSDNLTSSGITAKVFASIFKTISDNFDESVVDLLKTEEDGVSLQDILPPGDDSNNVVSEEIRQVLSTYLK